LHQVRLCGISATLRQTHVLVGSSEMSARSSIAFTSRRMERLFAHVGSNTRILTASQASEVIETRNTIADSHGITSNQATAGGSETSQESSDFVALPATHNMHDMQDVVLRTKSTEASQLGLASGLRPKPLRASNLQNFAQQNTSQTE